RIPMHPTVDPRSAEIVSTLSNSHAGVADIYEFGIPVYDADASTPRYTLVCTQQGWGICPFDGVPVPIPLDASPSTGSDATMIVTDWSSGTLYELWRYSFNQGSPTVQWGAVGPMTGSGRDRENGRKGGSTGAGVSRLAGIVRIWELVRGYIDHALVFSTSYCEKSNLRYPATQTDGTYVGVGSIPEGARIQLDPSVNVDSIPGITPGEKIVARALQEYGAYAVDCGGAPWAFMFESPSGESDPYVALGFTYDYFGMFGIPWDRMRVLRHWHGLSTSADFNGDGKTDFGVYRPSTGAWYVALAGGGTTSASWGTSGDVPVPGDYNGDGKTDFGVYRPSTGAWYVQGQAGATWGTNGDVPVPPRPAIP
ncbi:MAG: VCBS repeat-containing protein, partial [Actinobacteria bacterium]|nr:VCBS repeat-containing protein [Actinomycetota bacterium]